MAVADAHQYRGEAGRDEQRLRARQDALVHESVGREGTDLVERQPAR
jgi:hypothetical protein